MDSISPSELVKLSRKLIPTIWVLKGSTPEYEFSWTGFSVRSNGLVMTCAHVSDDISSIEIKARTIDEDEFNHIAIVVCHRAKWDLVLLQIQGLDDCKTGKFVEDGTLVVGQTLLHIGNPHDFVGSFFIGFCAYPCVDDVKLPTDGEYLTCSEFTTSLTSTPRYHQLGHVMNKTKLDRLHREDETEDMNYDVLVPIIQCAEFISMQGCSGGPIFNREGKIVGMLIRSADGYEIGIHVSLLKEFLKIALKENKSLKLDRKRKSEVLSSTKELSKKKKKNLPIL